MLNYVLVGDELYKKSAKRVLLKCLENDESYKVVSEVLECICGSHRVGPIMKWLVYRHD